MLLAMANNRKYEAPRLEELGSLSELTQASDVTTQSDGTIYQVPPGSVPGVPGGNVIGTTSH